MSPVQRIKPIREHKPRNLLNSSNKLNSGLKSVSPVSPQSPYGLNGLSGFKECRRNNPLAIFKCPLCRNPLDLETFYSGECGICGFLLRTKNSQNYSYTLEVFARW